MSFSIPTPVYNTSFVVFPKHLCTQFKKSNCSYEVHCEILSPATSPSWGQPASPPTGITLVFSSRSVNNMYITNLWLFILGITWKFFFLPPPSPLSSSRPPWVVLSAFSYSVIWCLCCDELENIIHRWDKALRWLLAHLSVFLEWALGVSFALPSVPLMASPYSGVGFLLTEEVWAGGTEISLPPCLGSFHVWPCPLCPVPPLSSSIVKVSTGGNIFSDPHRLANSAKDCVSTEMQVGNSLLLEFWPSLMTFWFLVSDLWCAASPISAPTLWARASFLVSARVFLPVVLYHWTLTCKFMPFSSGEFSGMTSFSLFSLLALLLTDVQSPERPLIYLFTPFFKIRWSFLPCFLEVFLTFIFQPWYWVFNFCLFLLLKSCSLNVPFIMVTVLVLQVPYLPL